MIKNILKETSINAQNFFGKSVDAKILVIESDDWGSIRMPSKQSFENLKNKGIPVEKCPYNTFDNLETQQDLEATFAVLQSFKDSLGNNLKITANTIVANPDFDKIRANNYDKYYYEDFITTYKRINKEDTYQTFLQGKSNEIFIPQLHGREHLQVNLWLDKLQEGDKETIFAFDNDVYGHPSQLFSGSKQSFLSAFHIRNAKDEEVVLKSIDDACIIFNNSFGFKSESFIAPRYIWNENVERQLAKNDINYIQGVIVQNIPNGDFYKRKINLFGKRNKFNQRYINRNVFFEPALDPNFDWVGDALKRIDIAFRWRKPAIISMHRLNFMGGLNENNRTNNLKLLDTLISAVVKQHPDVVFMSSNEIGNKLNNEK